MTHDFKKCSAEVLQRLNLKCHARLCVLRSLSSGLCVRECVCGGGCVGVWVGGV